MITWADVEDFAPQLAGDVISESSQARIIRFVQENVSPSKFCGAETALYEQACLNLAAHYATEQLQAKANAGNQGPVQSESVGGLSVSYGGGFGATRGATANSRAGYETTPYGATYLSLLRTSPCAGYGIMVV
jgi:hypothetical protein